MPDTPLVYVDLYEETSVASAGGRPQRWHWRALNGGNHEILAVSSEAYTNREDCLDAITELFGTGSNVYLRQHEQGNQVLRYAASA